MKKKKKGVNEFQMLKRRNKKEKEKKVPDEMHVST